MGYWDPDSRSAKRISRDIEKEYYDKFKQKLPGFYDDSEWWKLVETADQPPVEELPECPFCGAQNLKEAEICAACGEILKGKTCINDTCKKIIPASAVTCPHCGANQIPEILEPWTCKVCGKKNIATDDACKGCGSPRGAKHPLSMEELLTVSDKVDSLSSDGLSVSLADGSKSNPVKVQVYSTQKPIVSPLSKISLPLVIRKEIGNLTVFVDFSHPYFTKCGLSKEQMIASEIAMYLYQERMNLSSYAEHNLSNLTWEVLQAGWKDSIEISYDSIYHDAEDLLTEIRQRVGDNLGSEASVYFDELSIEQKKQMTSSLLQNGIDLSSIGELKDTGRYLSYVPFSFILTLFHEEPDLFFGGKVWKTSLASGGEELLGHDIVTQAREKIIQQYENYLGDLIIFHENKYSDMLTLQRVSLSIAFLRKDLTA